eukprot:TRINITY_DN103811_c0_g1_i1.p1 TRINITY_DN103811_c0_g1~~TRINITY_DN103811_c0_g1_i1.p1  ORF type:complete len:647 (-),score=79.12 TRINITY_DN103811_c0_g1_i1:107-2047(-)
MNSPRQSQGCTDNLFVAVRIKPFPRPRKEDLQKITAVGDTKIHALNGDRERTFTYDCVFTGGQEPVFEKTGKPMVEQAFEGFNVCMFAYGVTGSGKSYSMYGGSTEATRGIVPRAVDYLFQLCQDQLEEEEGWTMKVVLQSVEVYNEKVRDLLQRGVKKGEELANLDLGIHEHTRKPFVKGVSKHVVTNLEDVQRLVDISATRRQTSPTNRNEVSSRSHSILQLFLTKTHAASNTQIDSTLTFVDLAGSERIAITDPLFSESKSINQSLLTLGRVLNYCAENPGASQAFTGRLSAGHKKKRIPFLRSSKLTRLLGECFGGNSRTYMLATIVSCEASFRDSLFTLSYAQNAKSIQNRPKINMHPCTESIEKVEQVQGRYYRDTSPVEEDDIESQQLDEATVEPATQPEWLDSLAPPTNDKPATPEACAALWSTPAHTAPQPFHIAFPHLTNTVTALLGWPDSRQAEVDTPGCIAALCAEIIELRQMNSVGEQTKEKLKAEASNAWTENITIQEQLKTKNNQIEQLKENNDILQFKIHALERINHEIASTPITAAQLQHHHTTHQVHHVTSNASPPPSLRQPQPVHVTQHQPPIIKTTHVVERQIPSSSAVGQKKVYHQRHSHGGARMPFGDISNQYRPAPIFVESVM